LQEMSWCTIESDPGVFTELLHTVGVKGVQVEELYDLSTESLTRLSSNIYGLIFLFKWQSEADNRPVLDYDECQKRNVFFARQVINNACATQAILSILFNIEQTGSADGGSVQLGEELTQFKNFCAGFGPEMTGESIGNSEVIRQAHNSFARPEPFVMEKDDDASNDSKDQEDVFHFIAYVPKNGLLYELDGLKPGPIELGSYEVENLWFESVVPFIEQRIQRYAQHEIKFNLLAVVKDRRASIQEEMASLSESDSAKLASLKYELEQEDERRAKWREENIRRRHNYVPFLVNLLKVLAQKNELMPLVEQAKKKFSEQQQQSTSK